MVLELHYCTAWITALLKYRTTWIITAARLRSTKPGLRFSTGSNPACGVSAIRDGEDIWQWSRLEIRLNAFRRSTIPPNNSSSSSSSSSSSWKMLIRSTWVIRKVKSENNLSYTSFSKIMIILGVIHKV